MRTDIVLLSGPQGSGKTTLSKQLTTKLYKPKICYAVDIRFAAPLYHMHDLCRRYLESLGIKFPEAVKVKDGNLLQLLGTEWGRKTIADDIWIKAARGQIERAKETLPYVIPPPDMRFVAIISDCRFKNEFDAFPEALRVRLECPRSLRKQRAEMWRENENHPSEIDLDDYAKEGKFDMTFRTDTYSPEAMATLIMAQLEKQSWKEKRQ